MRTRTRHLVASIVVAVVAACGKDAKPVATSALPVGSAPRKYVDTSGFAIVGRFVTRWDAKASLADVAKIWDGVGYRLIQSKELDRPAGSVALALGVVALVATVLGLDAFAETWPQTAIGIGGVERWIAYPVLLWMVLFGTALMGKSPPSER